MNSSSICVKDFHWLVSILFTFKGPVGLCDSLGKLHMLLADPAFLFKLTLERGFTIGYGIWWECQHHGERISLPLPSVSTSALSHGAFLGVSGNLQYQLLNGAERVTQQHFNHLGVVLFCSTVLRVLNIQIGDVTCFTWLGFGELARITPAGLQKCLSSTLFII
ncbi:hypothetical protein BDL97_02G092100 [Sphagnum fallax]|nr:hypothetical protein BDL97_02G092100 [Sphagnum fallax]